MRTPSVLCLRLADLLDRFLDTRVCRRDFKHRPPHHAFDPRVLKQGF
jgi:hypothetical protein